MYIKRKAGYDGMRAKINEFKEDVITCDHSESPVELMYMESETKTQKLMDKYIPTKMVKGNSNHP